VANKQHTLESLQAEALKYETRIGFSKGSPAEYSTARRLGILDDICSHMIAQRKEHTLESLQAEALKYETRAAFQGGSPAEYSAARRLGILNDICSHMIAQHKVHTLESLQAEALKYETMAAFKEGSRSEYYSAHKRGIIPDICSHMIVRYKEHTLESLQAEALKYETRLAFKEGSPGKYSAACKLGILNDICSHMKRNRSTTRPELVATIALSTLVGALAVKDRNREREFDSVIKVGDYYIVLEYNGIHHYKPIFGMEAFKEVQKKDADKLKTIKRFAWLGIIVPNIQKPFDIAEFVYMSVPNDVPRRYQLREIDWDKVYKITGDRFFKLETEEDLERVLLECKVATTTPPFETGDNEVLEPHAQQHPIMSTQCHRVQI